MTTQITLRQVVEQVICAYAADTPATLCVRMEEPRAALTEQAQPTKLTEYNRHTANLDKSNREALEKSNAYMAELRTKQIQPSDMCSALEIAAELGKEDRAKQVQPAQGERGKLANKLLFEAEAMHKAMAGEYTEGTFHTLNWADKPHRVVYDACKLMKKAAALLQSNAERVPLSEAQIEAEINTLEDGLEEYQMFERGVAFAERHHKIAKGQQ